MSNEKSEKKVNKLTVNKETIADLQVENANEVVGGKGYEPKSFPSPCCPKTPGCPIAVPKSNYCGGPA